MAAPAPTAPAGFKIIEMPVDAPNTVRRILVPADTTEEETPVGSRLLSEDETRGQLARSASPDKFKRGDPVRLKAEPTKVGHVVAILRSGSFTIKWDGGLQERLDPKLLEKIY